MRVINKPWLAGLVQAFSVFCFTLLLYFTFYKIIRFTSFPYRTVDPAIITTVSIIAFIIAVITYALVVFAYPLYLFSNKKAIEGIKTVVFTAVFLLTFFVLSVLCIYLFAGKVSLLNQGQPVNPVIYMSQEDALRKAEETKAKSENARLEYENQQNNKTMPTKVINITPENRMYPYVIDINTGEKTPINP